MSMAGYVLSLSKHKRFYWVVFLSFCIAVFFRIPELEIWLLPKLTPSRYFVVTEYPNHSAEDTDLMVSLPISEILSSVKSVERIRTISEHGKSIIQIDLLFGASIPEFTDQLYQTLFEIKDKLPLGVGTSRLLRGETMERPFMEILIPKFGFKDSARFGFSLQQLQFQLERIAGVTEVRMVGKPKQSSFVSIHSEVLNLYPISIRDLESQIQSAMRGGSLGKIEGYTKDTELKFSPEISSHGDLTEFPIDLGNGKSTPLGTLAKIFQSPLPPERLTRFDGKDTIYLAIFTDSDANPLRVSSEIQEKLKSFEGPFPHIFFDVSTELRTALWQFVINLIWGLGFAFLFSYFLYRSFLPALFLFVSVFFSLILFFHLILLFSISVNLLSLGGISVGIGMLFDASNLTVFSIRKQGSGQSSSTEMVTKGIQSVLVSLFSSSFTTIVVFIPLLVFPMEWKDFLFDSGISIALLVFCSLVSSLWIVPLLAVSFDSFLKDKEKVSYQENILFRLYEKTYQWGNKWNPRRRIAGFCILLVFLVICFRPKLEIFPKQPSVGICLETSPKHRLSLEEGLGFVSSLEERIKKFDPKISVLVLPLDAQGLEAYHPKKTIPIQWKLLGVENEEELKIHLTEFLSGSGWDWKWEPIASEVSLALPFVPMDSIVFLHESWEALRSFAYEWKNQTNKLKLSGNFDLFPKQITLEEWSRLSIPVPELNPNEEDLKQRILYEQVPKHLGEVGDTNKGDLYLGIESSDFRGGMDWKRTGFKSKTNDLIYSGSIFTTNQKVSYDQFYRESGLYFLEWNGEPREWDPNLLKNSGVSVIEISASKERNHFFLVLLFLLLIAFVFIYLALVGIYESFGIPIFYLGISVFYLLITTSFVWILLDSFHLGHYIGLVVLLGLSVDSISLFGERWMEIPKEVPLFKRREVIFRWLVWPILLNAGTTMMGFLPVIFLGTSGSEFSRAIALTMFVGIPISLVFVFYLYPVLFPYFLRKRQ